MFLENVIFSLNEAFRTYDPVYVRKKTALISPNAYCMYTRTSMHRCIHYNRDRFRLFLGQLAPVLLNLKVYF